MIFAPVNRITLSHISVESFLQAHFETGNCIALSHCVFEVEHKMYGKFCFDHNVLNPVDFNMGPNVSPKSGTADLP